MNTTIKEDLIELLGREGYTFILEENNEHDMLFSFINANTEKGLYLQKKIANKFTHKIHAVGIDDSNSAILLFVEFNSIKNVEKKYYKNKRSIITTPKRIQPYYKAWMKASPNEPRTWEIEWKNNLHYSNWICQMQIKYRKEVLEKYMDYSFIVGLPYSINENDKFITWLFREVNIDCDSIII